MVAYTVKLKIDRGRTINRWNLASPLSNTLPVLKVFSYPFFLLPGFNANVFVAAFLALPRKPLIALVYSLLSPSCKTIELRACDQFGVLWSHYIHYIMLTLTRLFTHLHDWLDWWLHSGLTLGYTGIINSWARLSDVSGHRDVTAKWGVRRATSRIFENGGVIVFHVDTLSLFFLVNEAVMWFLFSSRIPLPHIPAEKVSVFWLLRENSAKKVSEGFWWVSKLGKLCECGAAFRSTKTQDKKDEKTCSFAPK